MSDRQSRRDDGTHEADQSVEGLVREPQQSWDAGWAEHELAQRLRLASLPFALKLAWLEETHRLVLAMQQAREREQSKS